VTLSGLAATVDLQHAEPADQLDIETFGGFDIVGTGGFVAGTLQVSFDGIPIP
jgi:hypothetical protein